MSEGSRSIREWAETNFAFYKNQELIVEVWDRASQIDFHAAKYTTDESLLAFLASDDTCEVNLRRLASLKYKMRTGDKTGATAMLGIKAPGSSSDVAPGWLVQEVTAYSTAEHKRAAMVKKGGGKGKEDPWKSKGKGKEEGKGGPKGGAAAAPP